MLNNPYSYSLEEYIIACAMKGVVEHKFTAEVDGFGVISIKVSNDTNDLEPHYIVCDNYLETLNTEIYEVPRG